MKVLIVHKTYKGGVAVHVKEIKNELRRRGIEVTEVTRNEDLGLKSFLKSLYKMKIFFKKNRSKYDIIHTHDWSITYPALISDVRNLVATFHAFPTNVLASYFQKYCIDNLKERAVVVSPIMKRIYTNATCIPNGVNLNFFKRKSVDRLKFLVGLAQEYNKEKIIEVIKKVKMNYISTDGKLPFSKLPEFYSKIEVFISIPYKQAGFNMVWLEAMACEVPYIIGNKSGIGELLPIYKIRNFKELEEVLIKIKRGEIKPLKSTRSWIIKNNLTWKSHVDKLITLYEKLIK